jgi:O-methyltransferase
MAEQRPGRLLRSTEIQAGAVAGAATLRSPVTDQWVRLEGVAARIWEAFEYPAVLADAVVALRSEYDAAAEEIAATAAGFLRELEEAGLVEEVQGLPPEPLRCRYLWLLKRALLNLLYPELELRVRLLSKYRPSETGVPLKRRLRDIGETQADDLARLVAGKRTGNAPFDAPHTMIGLHRLNNIERCAERLFADGVEGDFLEAGVCQGGATIFMRALQVAHGQGHRRTWVVDSFEGVPPSEKEVDRRYPIRLEEAREPWLACSLARVRDNFVRYGLLDDGVEWVPGWVSESLPAAPIGPLALLRIDVDLYSPTAECLDLLYDRLVPGGFLIVDDYGFLPSCRDAVDDFRRRRGIAEEVRRIDYSGIFWRKSGA